MSSDGPKRSVREELHGGGTSLGDGGFPWLLVGVGGAAALAAVVWWVAADDNGRRGRSAANAAPEPIVRELARPARVEPPPPPPPRDRDEDLARRGAAAGLERVLAADQLWATVEVDGDTVVIRSAFCEDAGLASRVTSVAADLRNAGFRVLRCLEQHGSVAFERPI